VLFEERPADVLVQAVGEVLVNVEQPFLKHVGGRTRLDAHNKESDKPLQRVLVHRIDEGKVDDAEEEEGSPEGDRPVALSRLINLLLG